MIHKIIIIYACVLLVACVTPPRQYQFNNSIEVKDSYDNTWERIVEFFANNHIQIKNIAKDSGLISAEKSSFKQNVADCGRSEFITPLRSFGHINVFVKSKGNIQTVSVNTEFRQTARNEFNDRLIERMCNSTGILENAILTKVGRVEN